MFSILMIKTAKVSLDVIENFKSRYLNIFLYQYYKRLLSWNNKFLIMHPR